MSGSRWAGGARRRLALLAAVVLPLGAAVLALTGSPAAQAATAGAGRASAAKAGAVRGPAIKAGVQAPADGSCTVQLHLSESHSVIYYGFETVESFTMEVAKLADQTCTTSPTGDVTLLAGSTQVCEKSLGADGAGEAEATCSISTSTFLPVGGYTMTIRYGGGAYYSALTGAVGSLTVSGQTTSTSLALSAPGAVYGSEGAETLSVSVAPQADGPVTGTVVVTASNTTTDASTTVCTPTLSSGAATCTLTSSQLPIGTYSVTATYGGDAPYFTASTSAAQSLGVNTEVTTTILTAESTTVVYGNEGSGSDEFDVLVGAPDTDPPVAPTGTVTISAGGTELCSVTLDPSSSTLDESTGGCVPTTELPVGTYTVTATYSPDGSVSFVPSSGSASWQVLQATTTTQLTNSPLSVTYGEEASAVFDVAIHPEYYGALPSGTVTIEESGSGTTLCTFTLTSATSGSCSPTSGTLLDASSDDVIASYAPDTGDNNWESSASSEQSFTVGQASTSVQLKYAPTADYGQESAEEFTATVSPAYGGTPTGKVTVVATTEGLCTITLSGGTGSCEPSGDTVLSPGTYVVQATYEGDANFSASDATATLNVVPGSATSLKLSPSIAAYGSEGAVKFTAKVTGDPKSSGTPAGTVTVGAGGATLCTITLAGGTGSCTMGDTALKAGTYLATASYGGDSTFAGSSSATRVLTIAKDTSATSLKLAAAQVTFGHENAGNLAVQVTSSYPGKVAGKVTITAKAGTGKPVKVCVITLESGTGTCALAAKALKAGTYTLTAAYGGGADILKSQSPRESLTVRK